MAVHVAETRSPQVAELDPYVDRPRPLPSVRHILQEDDVLQGLSHPRRQGSQRAFILNA